jgi:hypothetical protein
MRPVNEADDFGAIRTVSDLLMLAGKGLSDSTVGGDVGYMARIAFNKGIGQYSYSSVAKAAAKLMAIFPVIISKNISKESADRVQKYVERQAVTMLQLALQQANISSAQNGIEYLRQFHQNLTIGSNGLDALGDVLNTYQQSLERYGDSFGESNTIASSVLNQRVMESIVEALSSPANFESDDSLVISPSDLKELLEVFRDNEKYQVYDTKLNPTSINEYSVDNSASSYNLKVSYLNEDRNSMVGRGIHSIDVSDVKKLNNDVPSKIVVQFCDRANPDAKTSFVIGVKAKLLACDSTEILRRIANDNKDGKFFINLLRVMTGELKKSDFMFGLSRTYEDLASTRRKGARGDVWALLKNRAFASKEAVKRGMRNNYSAITTVVITRDDADDLFKEENIDITDIRVATRFISSYNLFGIIIVDDSIESMKVLLDDGSNAFEEWSYQMLEREASDGSYKKLINLIANTR